MKLNNNDISKLKKQILNLNLNKQPKEVLNELVNLFEKIMNKSVILFLIEELENFNTTNMNNIELKLFESRLKSLTHEITKKKYIQKSETSDFAWYFYEKHIDIYFLREWIDNTEICNIFLQKLSDIDFCQLEIKHITKTLKQKQISLFLQKNEINEHLINSLRKFSPFTIKCILYLNKNFQL